MVCCMCCDDQIGASRINGNLGSAKGSVREIEEMEMILSERLKRVEETSRAIAGISYGWRTLLKLHIVQWETASLSIP